MKHTHKIYEEETGNKCPSNQIAYHEWYIEYVAWLEKKLLATPSVTPQDDVWKAEALMLVRRHIPHNALAKEYILNLLSSQPTPSTHSEAGGMHSQVKRIEVVDRILHDLMGVGYGKGSPQNELIFECTIEIIQYLENQLLTPTKPVVEKKPLLIPLPDEFMKERNKRFKNHHYDDGWSDCEDWLRSNQKKFHKDFVNEVEAMISATKPVEITEEEIDQMFPLEVDKVMFKASKSYNQMQKHRREGAKAILTKLNGER